MRQALVLAALGACGGHEQAAIETVPIAPVTGEAIEVLRDVDTLVVDKTGTLTEGKPTLVDVVAAQGFEDETVLRLAASLERGSEHPLAAAIVSGARERKQSLVDAADFESITGKGVRGRVDNRIVALGNVAMMESVGVDPRPLVDRAEALRGEGETVMFVAIDGKLAGLVGVADPIKRARRKHYRRSVSRGFASS